MASTYRKRYKKRRTRKEQLQMRILMILIAVILLGSILGIIHKVKQERAQQTVSDSSWDITDKKYVDQRPELDVELLPVNEYSVRGLHLKSSWNCRSLHGQSGNDCHPEPELFRRAGTISPDQGKQSFRDRAGWRNCTVHSLQ